MIDLLFLIGYLVVGTAISWFLPEFALFLLKRRGISIIPTRTKERKMIILTITVLSLIVTLWLFPSWYDRMLSLLFWLLLVVLSLTDIWSFLLLDICTWGGIILVFLFRLIHPEDVFPYLISAVIAGIALAVVAILTKGIGLGDAKLLALAALVLGGTKIVIAFWLATLFGLFYALVDAWRSKTWQSKKRLPFGPHIALGSYVAWLGGDLMMNWLGMNYLFAG